ncbi:hypothetical protein [Nannocystis punicea]|uniref:Uncharacterized protein n=1 Tax=Nannocystis punicea TaxID=2995304 RepID=A0ABY7HGQ6_9BACT|nr:hypothetical protein [Nannocystis poenicansa]WAS98502.1 hypothetical protein O0S08_20365 [Nannocystis poenicansa]
MSKYDVSLVSAVEGRKRQILVDLLRQNSELTLGELHQLSKGELGKLLSSITVQELLHGEGAAREAASGGAKLLRPGRPGRKPVAKAPAESKPAKEAAAPAKAAKGAKAEPAAEVNTRTPSGREAFDQSVFEVLKSIGGPAGAGEIQRRVGGTNMQVRSAVNRLIEAGQVTWTGKARGTRYRVA